MYESKPTILVVDDSFTNRMLLKKIFSGEYLVEQAENGVVALEKLKSLPDVAAVILDIQMPELDGFGVLNAMREDELLRDIPVVVDTISDDVDSQLKALDCGAMDVLIKPFNPRIALHRVRNILTRREADRQTARNHTLEQLLRQSEIDERTGMYNKHAFCRKAAELLKSRPDTEYVIIRWDVDRFKVFNDVFGVSAGDAFLKRIGAAHLSISSDAAVFGHWESDHFVACLPRNAFEELNTTEWIDRLISGTHDDFEFVARLGVYIVDDPELDVALMCDRALLALRSIKNSYSTRVAYYDESMRAALLDEQEIVGEMDRALAEGQFVVYYQPQYDYATKSLHGAEALIRWQHPEKGLIPPGKFIPVFERNGFISKVDEYVWEQVCRLQRARLDAGLHVVPVSVNISRRDIYNPHLSDLIEGLVHRYRLPVSLLRLEITESAYMDNAEQLVRIVEKLRGAGFAVEMDDFGSGYSSLNTLKNVPVDMLKLDMMFLEESDSDTRGGSILTSVIRMCHWINLPVIAEGVETRAQAEYLKSIGCVHMQGYFFAKPMPAADFEALMNQSDVEGGKDSLFGADMSGAADFLSASTQATLLFNSFVGGASIIEYDGSSVEALRFNDKYFEVVGATREKYDGRRLLERFDEQNRAIYLSAIRSAIETGDEVSCRLCSKPLNEEKGEIWTLTRMRLLAASENRYILYCSVESITDEVRSKQIALRQAQEIDSQRASLQTLYDTIPCGVLEFELAQDGKSARLRSFNDAAWRICGYESRAQYVESLHGKSKLKDVHPDDLPAILACVDELRGAKNQTRLDRDHRILLRDGGVRWVRSIVQLRYEGSTRIVQVAFTDITEQKQEGERRLISALFGLYDEVFEFDMDNDICIMRSAKTPEDSRIGRYVPFSQHLRTLCDQYACPEERPRIRAFYESASAKRDGKPETLEYRYVNAEGALCWASATVLHLSGSAYLTCNSDVTAQKDAQRLARENAVLQTLFNERRTEDERNRQIAQSAEAPVPDRGSGQYPAAEAAAATDEMEGYARALFGLFDEAFELDYSGNTFTTLMALCDGTRRDVEPQELHKAVESWAARFVAEEDRAAFLDFVSLKSVREASQKHNNPTLEYTLIAPDGSRRRCLSLLLELDANRCLCLNRDVTEQYKAEQSQREKLLQKSREEAQDRYRIVVEQTGTAVIDRNYVTGEYSYSEAYAKYETSRRNQEAMLNNSGDRSLVHPDDQDKLDAFFQQTNSGAERSEAVLRIKMVDGSFRWTRMAGTYMYNQQGELIRAIGTFTDVDEEMRSKRALEELTERMGRIIANIPTGVLIFEAGEKFLPVYVSDRACEMFGFTREEYELRIANGEPLHFMPDASALSDGDMEKLLSGQSLVLHKLRVKRKDGGKFWLRAFMSLGESHHGVPLCYAVLADISSEVELERRFMWQAEKYKILSESADMITFDYSPPDDVMRISVPLPGQGFTEDVREHYLETFEEKARMPDKGKKSLMETLRGALQAATRGTYDFLGDYYQTGARWYRAKYVSLADEDGRVYRVMGRLDDINDMKLEQNQLRADAETDAVTGVYNKRYAVSAINRALREKSPDCFDAVMFLDVDNFKALNDTYGHLEADEVLRQVGAVLRGLFRKEDVIARFGGDEFVIYMRAAGDIENVMRRAAEIIRAVNGITVGDQKPVGCSIGVTSVIGEGSSYEGALKRADMALYEAKEGGKNQFAVLEHRRGGNAKQ